MKWIRKKEKLTIPAWQNVANLRCIKVNVIVVAISMSGNSVYCRFNCILYEAWMYMQDGKRRRRGGGTEGTKLKYYLLDRTFTFLPAFGFWHLFQESIKAFNKYCWRFITSHSFCGFLFSMHTISIWFHQKWHYMII